MESINSWNTCLDCALNCKPLPEEYITAQVRATPPRYVRTEIAVIGVCDIGGCWCGVQGNVCWGHFRVHSPLTCSLPAQSDRSHQECDLAVNRGPRIPV